jgi:hypothetical protein
VNINKAVGDLINVGTYVKSNPDFNAAFEAFPIVAEDEVNEWEQVIREEAPSLGNYVIPASLREVYRATGALKLHWVYRNSKDLLGVMGIVGITSLYQTDDEASEGMTIEDCFKELRPFDVMGSDVFVGMRLPESGDVERLVYVDKEESMEAELTLNPVQYILELSRYKGLWGWQKLFFKGAKAESDRRALAQRVEQLFPSPG